MSTSEPVRTAMPRRAPEWEPPVPGETPREADVRRARNRDSRDEWHRYIDTRCADCGMVRFHVSHEMDPEHSAEGPEYHAEFAHHPFVEPVR